mmetsp:Transcript_23029/g.35367  ORF Transcript_23029/g.35367 Transcript_23029/m.35367 type:complete len:86 (+) Transcript_23029:70-327(+)
MCSDVTCSLDEHINAPFSTPKAVSGDCHPGNIFHLRSRKQQEKNASGMSKIVDGDHANGSKQRFQQLDSIRGELFSATKIGACIC